MLVFTLICDRISTNISPSYLILYLQSLDAIYIYSNQRVESSSGLAFACSEDLTIATYILALGKVSY